MGKGFVLSEADVRRLRSMLNWYERTSHNPPPQRRRSTGGGGSAPEVRRAITTAAAGSGITITANLYDDDGVEQTEGDEAGITVYCTIISGSALNAAVPRLADNTDIFVVKLPSDEGDRWYCLTIFQTSENCTCTAP